jgi:hypothetical protein
MGLLSELSTCLMCEGRDSILFGDSSLKVGLGFLFLVDNIYVRRWFIPRPMRDIPASFSICLVLIYSVVKGIMCGMGFDSAG